MRRGAFSPRQHTTNPQSAEYVPVEKLDGESLAIWRSFFEAKQLYCKALAMSHGSVDAPAMALATPLCIGGAYAMAIAKLTTSPALGQVEPAHIDLLRRYCPGLARHTHAEVAAHIQINDHGCWPWDGRQNAEGYGYVKPEGAGWAPSVIPVHRYMFDTLVGPVMPEEQVHHRCEYKPCWHPLHLEALTPREHRQQHPITPRRKTYLCDAQGQFVLFGV